MYMVLFCVVGAFAQDERSPDLDMLLQNKEQVEEEKERSGPAIIELGNEFQNSIQLLGNRFRIDNDVDEVTMVFFREPGSSPIVLVRPDGSKVFLEDDDDDNMLRWYETETYDMISIKKPMPGPWQAVGQVLDGSKIMVIADIVLDAKPIPPNIYSGEIIKQTAVLRNAGKQVDFSPFRDVVSLSIDFVSNNNPNYENFGLGSRTIARFQDNGEGFDEVAADGVFTGQFNLSIPSGEWRPTFSIRTPMYTREQINETVILHKNPIRIETIIDETNEGEHVILIDVDPEHIKLDSLLVDGKIKRPNGETDNISLTELSSEARKVKVLNDSFGIYRINITTFAETVNGRDVIIDVPEHTFVTKAPPPPEPEPVPEAEIEGASPSLDLQPFAEPIEPEWSAADTFTVVIAINLCILIFGGLSLFLIINKRNNPDDNILMRLQESALSLLSKIKNIIPKKSAKTEEATSGKKESE
jgi:uncharacterized protein (TIGR03503 family)